MDAGARKFALTVGGAAGALALFWLAVLGPIRASTARQLRVLEESRAALEKEFAVRGLPAQASVRAAEDEGKALRKALAAATKGLQLGKADAEAFDPVAKASDPGLYYTNRLEKTRAAVRKRAGLMPVPGGLGLATEIPGREEIPLQLFRLAVVEKVVDAAATAGLSRIETIEFLPVDAAGCRLRRRVPIVFETGGSLRAVVRFLHEVSRPGSFLGLAKVAVTAKGGGEMAARVELAGLSARVAGKKTERPVTWHKGRGYGK